MKKEKKKFKRNNEKIAVLLAMLSVFLFISFATYDPLETPGGLSPDIALRNYMGIFGIYVSYYLIKYLIGYATFTLPLVIFWLSYNLFTNRDMKNAYRVSFYILGIGLWISSFVANFGIINNYWWKADSSGLIGYSITHFMKDIFGVIGYSVIMVAIILLLISGLLDISIYEKIKKTKSFIYDKYNAFIEDRRIRNAIVVDSSSTETTNKDLSEKELDDNVGKISELNDVESSKEEIEEVVGDIFIDEKLIEVDNEILKEVDNLNDDKIEIEEEVDIEEGDLDSRSRRISLYKNYKFPSISLLEDPVAITNSMSEDQLKTKADELIHALSTFGVEGRVVKISPGPVITLFEIEPAEGVRVNKFVNLSDDLARVLRAQRIRIIAPIPGTRSIGVELPNENPSMVYLKSIINSEKFIDSKSKLTIAVGKNTVGEAYVFDLAKMPHLLVAGATGSGKSVCINTIIISILYKAKPDEVKFIMIDPKKLELATYTSLVDYHLITAKKLDEYVMTTPGNSMAILNSAITEMERRFQVFADAKVRNIEEYHNKSNNDSSLENIPFLVVLVDELADLMMTSGRAVEEPITRLAQKARAVGIHLVLATQRPSVDVITGLIKSNFPARMSFQVSSKIDSRTILDQNGAEKLLGKGDLLFLLPGSISPIRLHNAYIGLEEIENIMEHISSQPKPEGMELPEVKDEKNNSNGSQFSIDGDSDEFLYDAAKLVVNHQQASVSLLQRKFRIGYSRAGRLIDELESLGIVSGYSGSKAREVLVNDEYLDEVFHRGE